MSLSVAVNCFLSDVILVRLKRLQRILTRIRPERANYCCTRSRSNGSLASPPAPGRPPGPRRAGRGSSAALAEGPAPADRRARREAEPGPATAGERPRARARGVRRGGRGGWQEENREEGGRLVVGWRGGDGENAGRGRRRERAAEAAVAARPGHSGMFPCLRGGVSTRLVRARASASIRAGRVRRGSITSST